MYLPRLVSAISISLVAALAAGSASAQPAPRPRTFGIDGVVVLPLGDYGKAATLGLGALGRIEFPVMQQLSITGRAGVIFHIMSSDANGGSLTFIPVYGGVRYSLSPDDGFYLAGELGATVIMVSADTGLGSASDSQTKFGLTLGGGLRRGRLDARLALLVPDLDHTDNPGIMGSVGYDFVAF